MLRAKNVNNIRKSSSLSSILMLVLVALAVIGGYALYKGSISFSIQDGKPQIDAANYNNAKPIMEAKRIFNDLKEAFK